jgi:poly-gamma-glutamate synthesis protein (capsule biosynthesis protein)
LAIDSGGDLVIGHHPHWVQGQEEYKGKRIFYSLGNFVFDQMWSEKTKEGLAIRLTFDGDNL